MNRLSFLQKAGATASAVMFGELLSAAPAAPAQTGVVSNSQLVPVEPIAAIFDAIKRNPLVGISENHFLQEWHDFITALLLHPDLPQELTNIVVEFGNSHYQPVADRFILNDEPVARDELADIWRFQGWDSPVYEQFFRTVRALNWMRRDKSNRIRVVLGAPPFDYWAVERATPAFKRVWQNPPDDYYTRVAEQALHAGGRTLLIAGSGHLLRGIYADRGIVNVATRIERDHPGALYVVDTVAIRPTPQSTESPGIHHLRGAVQDWPRPALATIGGTALASLASDLSERAIDASHRSYQSQADALLYLGPGRLLTASQFDPTLFQTGPYRAQLERINPIISKIDHTREDLVALSLKMAQAGPLWWNQFS
jgi:hypothetical protein